MKIILLLLTISTAFQATSQSITIYKSNVEKTIDSDHYLDIGVVKELNKEKRKCCNYISYQGQLISSQDDSLLIDMSTASIKKDFNSISVDYDAHYLDNEAQKLIAKKDILFLNHYKSKNAKKTKSTLTRIGGAVMLSGIFTAINTLIFADNNKSDLWLASGIQFGAGLILGVSTTQVEKYFITEKDPWNFK